MYTLEECDMSECTKQQKITRKEKVKVKKKRENDINVVDKA